MSFRLILAASAALVFATPALAQEAPPAPPAAPAQSAPSPEAMAMMGELQAAGEAIEAALAELAPRAEAIRADAALSDADKRTRVEALLNEKQPQIDAFNAVFARFLTAQATSQGADAEEIQAAIPMVQAQVRAQMLAELMGEGDAPETAEDAE